MTGVHVLPNGNRLTEADYRQLVAAGVRRCSAAEGAARFAVEVGCDEKTMRAARDGKSSLVGSTLFNMLLVNPTVLDELAAHFGLRLMPLEAVDNGDARLLADIAGLGATVATALADGRIDHIEEQAIADQARGVVQDLTGRIAVADRKRARR